MYIPDKYLEMASPAYLMLENKYLLLYFTTYYYAWVSNLHFCLPAFKQSGFGTCPKQPEPQNLGFLFQLANAILNSRMQALLWVRDWLESRVVRTVASITYSAASHVCLLLCLPVGRVRVLNSPRFFFDTADTCRVSPDQCLV